MLHVLRSSGVPYLLGASVVGRLAAAMAALALVRLVTGLGGDYGYAAVVGAVYVIAGMIGQPFLSRVVDRSGRRRPVVLVSVAVATVGYVGTAAAIIQAPALGVASVAVAGFFTPPIEPVLRSLWPELVTPDRLTSAFALDAAAQEVGFIAGPLLTVVGIAAFGVQGNIVLMGAVSLAGGVGFALHPRLRRVAPVRPRPTGEQGHPGIHAGHGTPVSSPPFLRLVIVVFAVAVPVGALTIVATEVAALAGQPDASSWAIALNAAGALCGALLFGRFPPRVAASRLIRPIALGVAVLYAPTAIWGVAVPVWLVFAFVAGILLPPFLTQVFTHTPATVDEHHRVEANAWVISAFAVGIAAGTLVSGFVIQSLPTGTGVVVAVLACSLVGVLGAVQASSRALTRTPASGTAVDVAAATDAEADTSIHPRSATCSARAPSDRPPFSPQPPSSPGR